MYLHTSAVNIKLQRDDKLQWLELTFLVELHGLGTGADIVDDDVAVAGILVVIQSEEISHGAGKQAGKSGGGCELHF